MKEIPREEGLLVRPSSSNGPRRSPRGWSMWCALRTALLLEVDPQWAGAINTVLVKKGVRVDELHKETTAERPIA